MTYRAIFSGDRNWTGPDLEQKISALLLSMPKTPSGEWDIIIFHGNCRGVDCTVDKVARSMGFTVRPFPYRKEFGYAGGPIRNQEMLETAIQEVGNKVAVYVFHLNLDQSKGTRDMIKQAKQKGVLVYAVR